jgi:acyl-coenzyme A synthetase/AMP-(fatty) acid ligase
LLRSLLLFLRLQENDHKLLSNLKIWVCSGESLSIELSKSFFDYFNEETHILCNFYGSTEIMGDVTYFVCESKKQLDNFERIPIGQVLDNSVIYILDENFRPVKNGNIGELYVAGANVVPGYVNARDKERFIDNPLTIDVNYSKIYKTGDFASVHKGLIFYEGRIDSQIKIRGHRVDLSEVEKQFISLDYIEKGIVLCYNPGDIKSENKKTSIQVENDLKIKLADYMVPQVVILENIPLLVNGKIDRQTLLKMYENTSNNNDVDVKAEMDFCYISNDELDKAAVLFNTVAESIGRGIRSKISSVYYTLTLVNDT